MNDPEEERCRPAEMQERRFGALGMLDEARESAEQGGDAETDDDGDDDADVGVEVRVRLLKRNAGVGLLKRMGQLGRWNEA
jgi:hypothetical protein